MGVGTESVRRGERPGERESLRPLVVATVAALSVRGGELCCLLQPGASTPWRLPSHTLPPGRTLEQTARESLEPLLGPAEIHLVQLQAWLRPSRDPDGELEIGYLSLSAAGAPPAAGAQWWPVGRLPRLGARQHDLLERARRSLSRLVQETDAARYLVPAEFTLSDLQQVYEVVQCRALDKRNFRKWILAGGLLEATARERRDGAHRPARLHRFAERLPAD
ncbi:MAG: NUDIX hydrolase [Armatimonadota bacterium]